MRKTGLAPIDGQPSTSARTGPTPQREGGETAADNSPATGHCPVRRRDPARDLRSGRFRFPPIQASIPSIN
jgi:hypothetical protein